MCLPGPVDLRPGGPRSTLDILSLTRHPPVVCVGLSDTGRVRGHARTVLCIGVAMCGMPCAAGAQHSGWSNGDVVPGVRVVQTRRYFLGPPSPNYSSAFMANPLKWHPPSHLLQDEASSPLFLVGSPVFCRALFGGRGFLGFTKYCHRFYAMALCLSVHPNPIF